MTAFIRARPSAAAGVRWQVLYRTGGRRTPVRSAGTFATLAKAESVRDLVATELASCVPPVNGGAAGQLVYIAELGGLLKIGISIDPERRCRDLHALLLHIEPGGLTRERELHRLFSHLRVRGEFFRPGQRGEIRRYIARTQRRAA